MRPSVLLLSGQIEAHRHQTVGHDLELYEGLLETNLASSRKWMIMFSQLLSRALKYRLFFVHKRLLT